MTPAIAEVLAKRGMTLHAEGKAAEALGFYELVARAFPMEVEPHRLIGLACLDLGRAAVAAAHLATAVALAPGHALALSNLGTARRRQGAAEDAVAWLRRAVSSAPHTPELRVHLGGSLLDAGRPADAAAVLRSCLATDGDDAPFRLTLADALRRSGDAGGAEAVARSVLTLDPADGAGWRILSGVRLYGDDGTAAARFARRSALLRPDDAAARTALGAAETRRHRTRAAERALTTALALAPDTPEACNNLGVALLAGRHPEGARRALVWAQTLSGRTGSATSNLLLALNYDPAIDDEALAAAHRAWGAAVARPRPPAHIPHARLRLGYVSPDLKRHPVGYLAAAALEHHDRRRFEVHVFSDVRTPDDLTARLRAATDVWHDSAGWTDATLEAAVRSAGIDILVDLAGHTAGNRLPVFAHKPAPVQVSWLGYFHTTGLPTVDAVLTDANSVPPEHQGWFSERVVPLAAGRFCYAPPDPSPPVAPPPLLRRGHPTFGSFNNLSKLTPEVTGLWAALLTRVPTARLVLKWHTLDEAEERDAVLAAFAGHGVAPARLDLRGPSRHADMLADYADIDVALDPFPFCGCLTTLEALWMGVPVVTLEGRRPVSRQSLAILRQIGHGDLVAATADQYLDIAARLVADPGALAARRAALRSDMASGICDGARFAAAFEAALLELWERAAEPTPHPP